MNLADIKPFLERKWDEELIPRLVEYVKVPAKSPAFDASWSAHGHLGEVIKSADAWASRPGDRGPRGRDRRDRRQDALPVLRRARHQRPRRRQDRAVLRPPRQAAGDGRLARQVRSVDPGDRGRQALRPRRRRRRLRDLRGADRHRRARRPEACRGRAASASSRPARKAARPICPRTSTKLAPRFGDVQLVAGLDSGCGNYEQLWMTTSLRGLAGGTLTVEILDRRRALGRCQRHRAQLVPHRAPAARSHRRSGDRPADRSGVPRARFPPSAWSRRRPPGEILGDQVWKEFPWVGCTHGPDAHAACAADDQGSGRGDPQSHLAAGAVGHRRRRLADDRLGRQRAAAEDLAQAVDAPAADRRRPGGDRSDEAAARDRPAVQRARELQRATGARPAGTRRDRAVAQARAPTRPRAQSSARTPHGWARAARSRS